MSFNNNWSQCEKFFVGIDRLLFTVQECYGQKTPEDPQEILSSLEKIHFVDPDEQLGASYAKDLSQQIFKTHRDGIITSIVLLHALLKECLDKLSQGISQQKLLSILHTAFHLLISAIQQSSWSWKDGSKAHGLLFTATRNFHITQEITQALSWIGPQGNIALRIQNPTNNHIHVTQGLKIDVGYQRPYLFHSAPHYTTSLSEPKILITNQTISSLFTLFPCLHTIASHRESLVIFCHDITHDALAALTLNHLQNLLKVSVVCLHSIIEITPSIFDDIALFTGTKIFSFDKDSSSQTKPAYEELGTCASVELFEHETLLLQSHVTPEVLALKIRQLEEHANTAISEKAKAEHAERKNRLQGSIAILPIAADSYSIYHLALTTLSQAKRHGFVVGGGLSFLYAFQQCSEEIFRLSPDVHHILDNVCRAPLSLLLQNNHIDANLGIQKLLSIGKSTFGINVHARQIEDFFAAGILDPTLKIQDILMCVLHTIQKIFSNTHLTQKKS